MKRESSQNYLEKTLILIIFIATCILNTNFVQAQNTYYIDSQKGNDDNHGLSEVTSDSGESNTPEPNGVRDLQLHPPDNYHLTFATFMAPFDGTYNISGLAISR